MAIKVTVESTGIGACALTGKEGDGLTIVFEGEQPTFLSWRSFRQLLAMRATQGKPAPRLNKPEPALNGNAEK